MATEKRLIDANEALKRFNKSDSLIYFAEHYTHNDVVYDILRNTPTVDAVEVVRCKDCKYWKPGDSFGGDSLDDMQRIGGCPIMRFARREKDFCCEGERRTNAQE